MKNHKGETVSENDLNNARLHVANFWRENAKAKRKEDDYASHVSEEKKDSILGKDLVFAEEIEKGLHDGNFTIWQRMNLFLTGECVALLS